MKISNDTLKTLITGAARFVEEEGYLFPCRFTERQERYYSVHRPDFVIKTRATSSVCLDVVTDSDELSFSLLAKQGSSRSFFYLDLFVDGVMMAHVGEKDTTRCEKTLRFDLPRGSHRVTLYLPQLFACGIKELCLGDGASLVPYRREKRLLCLGDSITQGYDAYFPSSTYANLLGARLNAEVHNLAIGAEVFRPDALDPRLPFAPDIITVAFGTNDWGAHGSAEEFAALAGEYYRRVASTYPNARIFAITPIWRDDTDRTTKVGDFETARRLVKEAASPLENVTVIDGLGLIPHVTDIFSDSYLHPNDLGFHFYAEALYAAIAPHLD
ncbi:MAG: SGNH/GDSL hydrolase family protein [Ruminococcaceae bacterium]|nr:SGNH/GDSL hydrolase family protein [Oscillospiraceae bacterium]